MSPLRLKPKVFTDVPSYVCSVRQWAQGNVYQGTNASPGYIQAAPPSIAAKPAKLLDSAGNIVSRRRTDYPQYAASQFASVRAAGAAGDGTTDDTTSIQNFINANWGCKVLFFDAGTYRVTNTITIPTGSIVVGEVWSTIIGMSYRVWGVYANAEKTPLGDGANFADQNNPRPVVKVGNAGDKGTVEISDIVFSARGGSAG